MYDYYLTFAEEVERFWMGPLNWASGLFYLNRYVVLVGHIPIMVEFFWKTAASSKMQVSTQSTTRKLQPNPCPVLPLTPSLDVSTPGAQDQKMSDSLIHGVFFAAVINCSRTINTWQ